jgi:hypothetical protein
MKRKTILFDFFITDLERELPITTHMSSSSYPLLAPSSRTDDVGLCLLYVGKKKQPFVFGLK